MWILFSLTFLSFKKKVLELDWCKKNLTLFFYINNPSSISLKQILLLRWVMPRALKQEKILISFLIGQKKLYSNFQLKIIRNSSEYYRAIQTAHAQELLRMRKSYCAGSRSTRFLIILHNLPASEETDHPYGLEQGPCDVGQLLIQDRLLLFLPPFF